MMIFGDWLKDNQPPWNIGKEMRLPDWVTASFEEVWFRNTEFVLPGFTCQERGLVESAAVSLEANVVSFLERLCRRQSTHITPVTVEVAVDSEGKLEVSQNSIRRLLLVSYHLGSHKELLKVKVVIDRHSRRGYVEADKSIANPSKRRLKEDCLTMQKFREGRMNMAQVFESVGASFNPSKMQGFQPESVVAAILSEQTVRAPIYRTATMSSQAVLYCMCVKLVGDVEKKEDKAKAKAKEDEERAQQA